MGAALSGGIKMGAGARTIGWEGVLNNPHFSHIPGTNLLAVTPVTATLVLPPKCISNGGPFILLSSNTTMITWIVLQVLVAPVCVFVCMLGMAPNVFPCLSGRVVPDKIEVKDLVAVRVDGPPGVMKKAALRRAIIATTFFAVAVVMVVMEVFAIGASRYCGPQESSGDPDSAFWAMPYVLFGLVSCGSMGFAGLSIIRCWRAFVGLKRDVRADEASKREGTELGERKTEAEAGGTEEA